MEPINNQNFVVDYRDAPVKFSSCMDAIKKRFGYESDREIPWIFRNIPGAKEKCLSIEFDIVHGITIKFLKYKYRRDEVFLKMQTGKRVEGYFERNTFDSTTGFFYPVQFFREFNQLQEETINFPIEYSSLNAKIHALGLLCDGDNYLIPRELLTGRVHGILNKCFISSVAMDYLLIGKISRFAAFFNELLGKFSRTVISNNEASFHFATMATTGERKLAYVIFSDSLYSMKCFYDSFMMGRSFLDSMEAEAAELNDLPRLSEVSSYRDFPIDVDFDNYTLIESVTGLVAILNMQNFLDQIDEEPRNEVQVVNPSSRNNQVYESCDVFLFKSSWRFFSSDDRIQEQCIICFKKFEDNDLVKRFACQRHIFHVACINIWVDEHNTCPICKYKLSNGLAVDNDASFLMKKRSNH